MSQKNIPHAIYCSSIVLPILRSDASPWASVLRVEGVRSEVIAMHITLTWRDHCEAARMRNAFPLRGIVDDLQNLEQQYGLLLVSLTPGLGAT